MGRTRQVKVTCSHCGTVSLLDKEHKCAGRQSIGEPVFCNDECLNNYQPATDQAQIQTAPNLVWVFAESEAVPSCQKTGRTMDFMAPTLPEAARNLEYTLKLSDGRARLGKTGLVAYPHGIGGAFCWVFDAQETARAQGDRIPGEEVRL